MNPATNPVTNSDQPEPATALPAASRRLPLPPGPRAPMAVQSVLYGTQRHRLLPALHRHYGPMVRLRLFPERSAVSLSDPDDVRAVFSGPVTTYHAGEGNMILKPVMGPHSVLTTDEDEHRRIRKLLMPPFAGAALRGYRDMIAELAAEEVERWPRNVPFASHLSMQRLTLEVILRVVFGFGDGPRLTALRHALRGVMDIGSLDVFGWHSPTLQRFGRWRRGKEQLEAVDALLYAEIAERRGASDLADRNDVLSRLLAVEIDGDTLTDVELRDQLVTLLLAGHETTATALAWAFHELARNPRTHAEATRAADSGHDGYLEAVTKESMRLHPVITEVARTTTEPVELGGYHIPARTTVMPAIGVIHGDGAHHDLPDVFRPERFTGEGTPSSTWLPFGGGVRRCLGAGFALVEAVEILRAALTRYRLTPDRPRAERVRPRHITLVPARGARVVAIPR
ncbi:cytochrome P450 [Haloechinothrix sp. LS1_15]|uniref:cytochrome P450 n=1 Tax=Haloechinothrix sp. LS1_15 TaxID=2652248 RepID=UPI0029446104|nr:cytochrome P450 [Haloechinothrix sp. LS1_15]MDV6013959.1 cytochrome P450 [Haloechinothrix sp. LS1_15]